MLDDSWQPYNGLMIISPETRLFVEVIFAQETI
jgi:hypothetical protein